MTDFRCTGTVTNTNGSMTCSTGWREIVHVNSSESKTVFTDDLKIVSDVAFAFFIAIALVIAFCFLKFFIKRAKAWASQNLK